MPIATYGDLKSAIANFADRADLTARIPDFIVLAEARLNRMLRLTAMEAETPLAATPGSRFIALPPSFVEPIACFLENDDTRKELVFVPAAIPVSSAEGEPQFWTIDGGSLAFERACDSAYTFTLRHLQRFQLDENDDGGTNWLLAHAPDAYLFASLAEVAAYLMDDAQLSKWEARLASVVDALSTRDARMRGLATLRLEPEVARPRSAFAIERGF